MRRHERRQMERQLGYRGKKAKRQMLGKRAPVVEPVAAPSKAEVTDHHRREALRERGLWIPESPAEEREQRLIQGAQ